MIVIHPQLAKSLAEALAWLQLGQHGGMKHDLFLLSWTAINNSVKRLQVNAYMYITYKFVHAGHVYTNTEMS
jgi:hypothetical protein